MTDVVLVGAGIMSATLGTLLRQLDPSVSIEIFERLDVTAAESSDAWNNAGTGHSAFCELNYTPAGSNGHVDVSKAIAICEQFEQSKQFWAHLVEVGVLPDPSSYIRQIPHHSFVWGEADVAFLRARYEALQASPLFEEMEYSEDPERIAQWIPLVMAQREGSGPVAATRMEIGNDVNFGHLTRTLIDRLANQGGCSLHLHHEVVDFDREADGTWRVEVHDLETQASRSLRAKFVFIGAGGGSLALLERSGIPEAKGYGGFPVSGQWLRCTNPSVIAQHHAKVYGQAELGAPPMSVPHLDTRFIDGQKQLLFGPFAGFTTKFLKEGSFMDLFQSLGFNNIVPMMSAGARNIDLTRYLVGQVLLPSHERIAMLRAYYPAAVDEDWALEIAGLRVQIIKSDGQGGGVLKFGTEVVSSADGSMAGLLGASPGASTAVSIMLDVAARCFPDRFQSHEWQTQLRTMFPSFGHSLHDEAELCRESRAGSLKKLALS